MVYRRNIRPDGAGETLVGLLMKLVITARRASRAHTYALNWQAHEITWYFDGSIIHKTKTPRGMHGPMYVLINLAVGGEWSGDPDSSTHFPASLYVDYVRAYRTDSLFD